MSDFDEVAEATIIQPGDVLILRYAKPLTVEFASHLRERLRDILPELTRVAIIDNCDGLAVFRPGDSA